MKELFKKWISYFLAVSIFAAGAAAAAENEEKSEATDNSAAYVSVDFEGETDGSYGFDSLSGVFNVKEVDAEHGNSMCTESKEKASTKAYIDLAEPISTGVVYATYEVMNKTTTVYNYTAFNSVPRATASGTDDYMKTFTFQKAGKSILFSADFEDVESASDAGLTFAYGEANSAVESGYGYEYGNVMRFTATETTTSRFKVPVNATNPAGKTVSMSFDLYAEEADKMYCMIYLYDTAGTDYKILVRNSNQAEGQTGYFKFLTVGAPWKPIDCVTSPAKSWVHIDGIFEFRDNQTIIKWYFDGEYAGTTYSFALKDISYIRFNVNKTETADVNKTYAIDNVLMRQYENYEFEASAELTGEGAGTTLTINPKSIIANDFSAQNCTFNVTDAQTGEAVTVASKAYTDGNVVLALSGLEYNKPYRVSSDNFTDLYGQKMQDFEFYANPQYDTDGEIIPAVAAVWLYDYDGNRLSIKDATTEVSQIKVLFNTRMESSSVTGVTLGGLALVGEYSSKDNSYTATWGGYLAPESTYTLNITGAKSVLGKTAADFATDIVTGDGRVSVKDIELFNASGETATATDIADGAVLTAKANLLNTTGDTADVIMAYGIYKDSYMTAHDFTNVSVAADSVLPVTFEIPYDDADAKLKIFMWDELGVLNPYFDGFEPTLE